MSKPFDAEQIKKNHGGKIKHLFAIYHSNKPLYKSSYFWTAVISSVLTFGMVLALGNDPYEIIGFISAKIIDIMPDILGFNLGAYVLLIGLNSQSILDDITTPEVEDIQNYPED